MFCWIRYISLEEELFAAAMLRLVLGASRHGPNMIVLVDFYWNRDIES